MRKLFFLLCMTAAAVYAVAAEDIIRAYNRPHGGFVLLDDNSEVVGFSDEGVLTADNAASLKGLLACSGLELEIVETVEAVADDVIIHVMSDSVGPLLGEIAFNQGYPYNMYAPKDGNKQCVTGCVATAMAQIMAYWRYPAQCTGGRYEYTATALNRQLSLNYDTISFNWKNIIPQYGPESNDEQRREIAKLMYACGVSVNMNYGVSGSGTLSTYVANALDKFFAYRSGIFLEDMGSFGNDVNFISALIDELNARHPIYCSARATDPRFASYDGGHAFVIDGYGWKSSDVREKWNNEPSLSRQPYIHFNWGWGGTDQIGNSSLWYRITGDRYRAPYSNFEIIRGIVPANYTDDEQIEQTRSNDGKIYDILGREVKETIPGQIYISNGKKFFAR